MNRSITGIILILLGAGLYLNHGNPVGVGRIFGHFWPSLFVIPLGLFFHWLYFSLTAPRGTGLLIPGGIVFTAGIVCQVGMLFDNWGSIWPGFILAVAIGLFEFYWFGRRNKYMLIPISILTVVALLFFAVFAVGALFNQVTVNGTLIAVVLIVVGCATLLRSKPDA